jgi:hypothetical protein
LFAAALIQGYQSFLYLIGEKRLPQNSGAGASGSVSMQLSRTIFVIELSRAVAVVWLGAYCDLSVLGWKGGGMAHDSPP